MKLTATSKTLCIDPGTTHSGVVIFDGLNISLINKEWANKSLIDWMKNNRYESKYLAIEGIASYGMAVGATTFETVEWIGRFREAYGFDRSTRIFRKDVKMFLCNSMRAKDTNVRQRILDIFPANGGGKTPQIGTKSNQGSLYGVTSHSLSALAVGLTFKYSVMNREDVS